MAEEREQLNRRPGSGTIAFDQAAVLLPQRIETCPRSTHIAPRIGGLG